MLQKIEAQKVNFTTNYDDIEDITWIYSKTNSKHVNSLAFFTYIGLKNDKPWKRLLIRYHGENWLFINKIIIKTDSSTYEIAANDVKRDNNTDVWEWIDIPQHGNEDAVIEDIINSTRTKIRFSGAQYHLDWVLPASQVKGLKNVLDYYQLLEDRYYIQKEIDAR